MVDDYKDLALTVAERVKPLGFVLEADSEFSAVFHSSSGWRVVLEGERYVRPAFNLSLSVKDETTDREVSFSVRLLMRVLGDKRAPSLTNQLDFLMENHAYLLTIPLAYSEEYQRLDTLI